LARGPRTPNKKQSETLDDPWETSAEFLSESESELIADAFNGGPSLLLRGDGLHGSGFVSWCPYDIFLYNLAHDIERARLGQQVPRRYVILNNMDQRSTGMHWVTVVYEIKSLDPEATMRQSSELAVDAADRESALIPLAPFNEIRGGCSAMQAFAVVCAAMVASTVLQHTALRGIIERERMDRMDRSYRVWYKNQFLVS
jgi:hypothetical protein